jgi:SDR family mycofactocin-dependent oxidoreductase
MGTMDGKVAFITGGARGQGRTHALRLAQEGADVAVVDICAPIDGLPYALASKADLDETVDQVTALGRRAIGIVADIRDFDALEAAVRATTDAFGRLDVVIANAGIAAMAPFDRDEFWRDTIDVNLTGTYNTIRATAPVLIAGGEGGSIVIISSVLGLAGFPTDHGGALAYVASKHGMVGLMRSYANFLAPHRIRVNTIHPTGIPTPMVMSPALQEFNEQAGGAVTSRNALPVDMIEEIDISNAIAWMVSDAGRYVTGTTLPVDAGLLNN